jgi:hypothetical protein
MLSRYDPKSMSNWIELDFFRRPGRLRRMRRIITWACVLGALAVVGISLIPANHSMYEAGPVSPAHIHITECSVCHTQAFSPARRLWPGNASIATVPDSACVACHNPGPHHADSLAGSQGCSNCHHEHHGQARLAGNIRDAQCISCHADLKGVTGVDSAFASVTGFPAGHPEFRMFRDGNPPRDPGAIHFRHDVHLRKEGVPMMPVGPRPPKDALERTDLTWTRLECTNCHQSDDTGRYFKPINYTNHCASCHPLSVRLEGVPAKQAKAFARTPAPHLAPALVRGELRSRLFEEAARADVVPVEARDHPLPGRRRAPSLSEADRKWVDRQLDLNERLLFDLGGGCLFCHQETSDPARRPKGLPEFAKSNLEERWFKHARFRHQSHRMKDCIYCHTASPSSTAANDVLIPSMDNCKECHNPKSGVRNDCIGCHDYHHSPQRLGPSGLEGGISQEREREPRTR